jgi:flagellar biosynthesis protein FlhA
MPSTVVATHLNHLILSHAAELLGRQETQALLDHLAKEMPKLVEDLVPKALSLGVVQKVLRNLLEEGVPLRDMRTIIETLADMRTALAGPGGADRAGAYGAGPFDRPGALPGGAEMQVMSLDPQLERLSHAGGRPGGDGCRHRAGSGRYPGA